MSYSGAGNEAPAASPSPPPGTCGARQGAQARSVRFCKELLQSRLQEIKAMEEKLEKVSKYSIKLLDVQEKLSVMLAREKDDTIRLAAAAGFPVHDVGYVMSYAVALEQCCNILLDKE